MKTVDNKTLKKAVRKANELSELVDTQVEQLNGLIDSFIEYKEFLEEELERLKNL